MIAPMLKCYCVCRRGDRERMLGALRELGVVHVQPVDPARAVADEQVTLAVSRLDRARQILADLQPKGPYPDTSPVDAAEEVLGIQRAAAERRSRLNALYREMQTLEMWGDVRLEQFERLREAGVRLSFYSVPAEQVSQVGGECVYQLRDLPAKRVLVAVASRGEPEPELPEDAVELQLPARDRPSVRAEAAEIEQQQKDDTERLHALAHLVGEMHKQREKLAERVRWQTVQRSGVEAESLYAVGGWVPAENADTLADGLSERGVDAGVQTFDPPEDEQPPTLIKYPRWARPMKGLFDMLGTLPGYREMDLSGFFMIALPLFAGILIGDAGYGLLFIALGLAFYKRISAAAGGEKAQLVLSVGACALIWGVLSANYFGLSPASLASAGGYETEVAGEVQPDYDALFAADDAWGTVARTISAPALLWRQDEEEGLFLLMKIAFIIGGVHLALAHVRRVIFLAPDARMFADMGWCIVVVAMLLVVWNMVFGDVADTPQAVWWALLAGLVLASLFGRPHRNPLIRVLGGFAASLLPLINTFGDTISYIRLMAVGVATYFIALAFNGMAAQLAGAATWFAAAPVLVFGHGLNIAMVIIAIFAHGVRLNMLEFSSHVGVEWAGYPYEPFAGQQTKES
ncbi:MAG: V-type ATP synthase subunit I [Phycisphaerae bacterium]